MHAKFSLYEERFIQEIKEMPKEYLPNLVQIVRLFRESVVLKPAEVSFRQGEKMKTYMFKVVIEPDEDVWTAYCPALLKQGASTWGNTKEEALKHIEEVVRMVVESLIEHGEKVPVGPVNEVQVSTEPRVAVTI